MSTIHVDGLGFLDEYGSYIADYYEKNVIYFVRDLWLKQLVRTPERHEIYATVERLNSEILALEHARATATNATAC